MRKTLLVQDHDAGSDAPASDEVVSVNADFASLESREWHSVTFVLADLTSLLGLSAKVRELGTTTRFAIEVAGRIPARFLHAPSDLVDGRSVLELQRSETKERTLLYLRMAWKVDIWKIFEACVGVRKPTYNYPNGVRVATTDEVSVLQNAMLDADLSLTLKESNLAEVNPGPTPPADILLGAPGEPNASGKAPAWEFQPFQGTSSWSSPTAGKQALPPINIDLFNPIGVTGYPVRGVLTLQPAGYSGVLGNDENGVTVEYATNPMSHAFIGRLKGYKRVIDRGSCHPGPFERAQFLMACLSSGVIVGVPDLDPILESYFPSSLIPYLNNPSEAALMGELREVRIASQVREVHRTLSSRAGWDAPRKSPSIEERTVSVIMSTMRPEFLEHAIESFTRQTWARKQLVLGLHGFSLADAPDRIQGLVRRTAEIVEFDKSAIFGDVLRELTLRSDGQIVAKMDDDDWYGGAHLEDLVNALSYSGAELAGSGVQYIYLHNADKTIRRGGDAGYKFGGHPGGPTFMAPKSVILQAGNWPRVRRAVDTGLNHAVLKLGGNIFQSHPHNFLFNRRSSGHTWKATNEYFIQRAVEQWNGLRTPPGFDFRISTHDPLWRSSAARIDVSGGTYERARLTEIQPLGPEREMGILRAM